MMRSVFFSPDTGRKDNLNKSELLTAIGQPGGLLWVSLENPQADELQDVLQGIFDFHPLTIDDCLSNSYQTPKVDDFDDYIFIVMHAINRLDDLSFLSFRSTSELNFYLASNYLVTVHRSSSMNPVEYVWNRLDKDKRLNEKGADFLCHAVLDVLVDDYMPLLDQMDEEIDWLEDRVMQDPDSVVLQRILSLKHAVMYLRRIISPQREVMNQLSRDEFPMIERRNRIYFRDIYDHLVRIHDLTESIRDIISGSLDIYLSSTSLKMNSIMKALAIVSTTFLPLSFIAGTLGMNFIYNKDYDVMSGLPLFLGMCIVAIAVMIVIYKRLKWF